MIKLLLITHPGIGPTLLKEAVSVCGKQPLEAHCIEAGPDADPDQLLEQARQRHQQSAEKGLLVITDLFGSTPCNIACKLKGLPQTRVVSGLNLPMLIKLFNYPELSLDELTQKALDGGKKGIIQCLETQ